MENHSIIKSEIEPLPYSVKLEPMSLADTFGVLQTPDNVRKLITGQGWPDALPERIWSESSKRYNAADAEARAEEDRFRELVALHGQRCREREDVTRRMAGSQALEDPVMVGQRMGMEPVYERIIADLRELIEQQRGIATKAQTRAARFKAVDALVRAAVTKSEPESYLTAVFGVDDPLDLAPPALRSKIREERAKAVADEAKRQADAERQRETERQRADEEAVRLKTECAKIDQTPLEEIAAMFFKDEALRVVRATIAKGPNDPDGTLGLWQLEGLASQDSLHLTPAREYALDVLLKHFGRATVKERADRRIAEALNRPKAEPLNEESIAVLDDWAVLLQISGIGEPEVMRYFFAGGCTDGRGADKLRHAVENIKAYSPLAKVAIRRLNEISQLTRMKLRG